MIEVTMDYFAFFSMLAWVMAVGAAAQKAHDGSDDDTMSYALLCTMGVLGMCSFARHLLHRLERTGNPVEHHGSHTRHEPAPDRVAHAVGVPEAGEDANETDDEKDN